MEFPGGEDLEEKQKHINVINVARRKRFNDSRGLVSKKEWMQSLSRAGASQPGST